MDISVGSIITSAATIVGVVISNRLSARQTNSAKMWDLRREAYGVILSSLGSVSRVLEIAQDYIDENSYRYFESDILEKHDERISGLMSKASDRFTNDYLVLSSDFISSYEAMQSDLGQAQYAGFPDDHSMFAEAIWKHRPLLLAQARKEIMGKQQRKWFAFIQDHLCWFRSRRKVYYKEEPMTDDVI